MIVTEVNRLFGLKYPIIQGGMAWISDGKLAAAVSNAGGLGVISAINEGPEALRREIETCRSLLRDGRLPFAVNIMLMSPQAAAAADIVVEMKVPVVITGAGLPTPYMKKWLAASIQVVPVAPSTGVAKMAARLGACAVVAEGGESGGHVGDLTTMVLTPQVADAVSIPVIAAGGIADGRGVAAALLLGAAGVQCGTCFLPAKECGVHANYKRKILEAKDIDTIVTGKRLGHPVRSLKNAFSRQFADMEYDAAVSDRQIEAFGSGALRRAALDGDVQNGSVMAGQCAAMLHEEKTAEQIIADMFREAQDALSAADRFLSKEEPHA